MGTIAKLFDNSQEFLDFTLSFFKNYIGSKLLYSCGITKVVDEVQVNENKYCDNPVFKMLGSIQAPKLISKVISAKDILIDKLVMCYHMGTAYMMFNTDTFWGNYKKDTYYRFDKIETANWERLNLKVANNVINEIEKNTSDDCIKVLAVDDTLYRRTSGKSTELCGIVYDHNEHKNKLGYRMLTCAWTNGDQLIPVSQCLLTTRKDEFMVGPDKKVDKRTLRGKRRQLAKEKGTDVMVRMVEQARNEGIPFDYVTFDSWFSNPKQLIELNDIGTKAIAMIKKNGTKFSYIDPETKEEHLFNVKEIYSRSKKRRGKSRYLLSLICTVHDEEGFELTVKLIFARNRKNRKEWVCFVSTDISLDEEMVLRVYALRWNIETYFKIAKSYLGLCGENHSLSYDALTSHITIVAIRYMILVMARFINSDTRSIEEIFYQVEREVINKMMNTSIVYLLDALLDAVRNYFNPTEQQINEMLCDFIEKLPETWKCKFKHPVLASA